MSAWGFTWQRKTMKKMNNFLRSKHTFFIMNGTVALWPLISTFYDWRATDLQLMFERVFHHLKFNCAGNSVNYFWKSCGFSWTTMYKKTRITKYLIHVTIVTSTIHICAFKLKYKKPTYLMYSCNKIYPLKINQAIDNHDYQFFCEKILMRTSAI